VELAGGYMAIITLRSEENLPGAFGGGSAGDVAAEEGFEEGRSLNDAANFEKRTVLWEMKAAEQVEALVSNLGTQSNLYIFQKKAA
jgi:hypothetical protein